MLKKTENKLVYKKNKQDNYRMINIERKGEGEELDIISRAISEVDEKQEFGVSQKQRGKADFVEAAGRKRKMRTEK